jgi:RNA polymerase sigma factor (sigma-70 family)
MPPGRFDAALGTALPWFGHDPRPDAELLSRFLEDQDERAFEALLRRHTPAVRAACRGWLRAAADVDDAAQATFLVLVQRGRSIRNRAALGGWLYRVAANVARRLARQRRQSCPVSHDVPERAPTGDDDLREVLDEEVARLPEKYRLPVQLCYTVGLTTAEAARRLGWPKGTVLTRLAQARQRLQKCLTRRGVSATVMASLAAAATAPALSGEWLNVTARAARGFLAGQSPAGFGVSGRTISLTQGVVRAMTFDKVKYVVLAAALVAGLAGFGLRHWATASDGPGKDGKPHLGDGDARAARGHEPSAAPAAAGDKDKAGADEARPPVPGRRREAIIRLPQGTFIKEVDVAPYGTGRLTWTYDEDRVTGLIEGSAMGVEVEVATEAEYSLSSNGTIYGLLTSVRLNHLRLPDNEELAQIKPFIGLWPAVEPLINEMTTDLPFSYQFRVQGDRLIISNFRMLLSGPNPFGKVGGFVAGEGVGVAVAAFQAIGTAIEGTYTSSEAKDRPPPSKRSLFLKPQGPAAGKRPK